MATCKQPKYEIYVQKQNPETMEAETMCSPDHSRNYGEEYVVQRQAQAAGRSESQNVAAGGHGKQSPTNQESAAGAPKSAEHQ